MAVSDLTGDGRKDFDFPNVVGVTRQVLAILDTTS